MGVVAYPEMKKHGYSSALIAGSICAGGTLGILIPPSTAFIIYAIVAEQSIGRLFAAGILPSVVLTICYIMSVFITTRINPKTAPCGRSYKMKEKLVSLKGCIGIVVLLVAVLGGMFAGFYSPTEAAAVGAFLALLFMAINRKFSLKVFYKCVMDTIATTAMALFIVVSAMVFGYFISITGLPKALSGFINDLHVNKFVIIGAILVVYVVLGSVLDGLAMLLITAPIFLPIILDLGFSAIWFGVFVVMIQEIGLMTPPIGLNVFIVGGVLKEVPLQTIFRGIVPFVLAALVAIVIVIAFPSLATWLPGVFYG